jgi:hypothetical protein
MTEEEAIEKAKKQKVPHANKKLQNVKAVQQMLEGTHRTQTKTVYGYEPGSEKKFRKIGETWIDEQGNQCTQREGYILKTSINHEVFQQLRDELKDTKICPQCGNEMTKKLDKKYFLWHGKCMDCVIEMETKLRIEGKYEEYEKNRIKANINAFMKDAMREKEFIKAALSKDYEIVLESGEIEKWEGAKIDPDRIEEEFKKFQKRIYTNYKLNPEEIINAETDNKTVSSSN